VGFFGGLLVRLGYGERPLSDREKGLTEARLHEIGRGILEAEARALDEAASALDPAFVHAVEAIARCDGRLVVTGMGKAGFIARKISATFASTGTPSLFLHPADALHGDLGRITAADVVLALSHSGETEEMVRLVGPLRRVGAKVLAITATRDSSLARMADLVLPMGRVPEAGHGLAPTTSTTVMLGLGDALAMALLELRGFSEDDFLAFHPGGSLGRKNMRVYEVMRSGDMLPIVRPHDTLADVIAVMTKTKGRPGASTIVGDDGALVGMFTDGDLRRLLEMGRFEPNAEVATVMTEDPKCARPDQPVLEAASLLRKYRVDQVPVVDDDHRPVGLLDVQELLALRFL